MELQNELIKRFDWDVIILLDACRADKFEKFMHNFFDKVNRPFSTYDRVSTGDITFTRMWLSKTWGDKKYIGVNYISANGYVNSKGIVVNDGKYAFNAIKHFGKVHDIWDYGYNKDTSRVEPWTMVQYGRLLINRDMKNILHFQQPHAPYLFPDGSSGGFRNIDKVRNLTNKANEAPKYGISRYVDSFIKYHVPHTLAWTLGLECSRQKYKQMWKERGRKEIIKAYEKNLEVALYHIIKLINDFPNLTFVITADHGERLGEFGKYGHGGRPSKIMTTVPWMVIPRKNE